MLPRSEGAFRVFVLTYNRDAPFLQRQFLSLLRDLNVAAALLLDLLDVVSALADDHAGCRVRYQDLHLEIKTHKYDTQPSPDQILESLSTNICQIVQIFAFKADFSFCRQRQDDVYYSFQNYFPTA